MRTEKKKKKKNYISDRKKPPEFDLKIYIKTLQIKIISYITEWEMIHWRFLLFSSSLIDAQCV